MADARTSKRPRENDRDDEEERAPKQRKMQHRWDIAQALYDTVENFIMSVSLGGFGAVTREIEEYVLIESNANIAANKGEKLKRKPQD